MHAPAQLSLIGNSRVDAPRRPRPPAAGPRGSARCSRCASRPRATSRWASTPDLAGPERRGPFADRAGVQHVVAEELELSCGAARCSSGSAGSAWLCRKFICRRTVARPSRWSCDPRVVHPVVIEVREDLVRVQRPRRGEEHLIEVRGQAEAGRVGHRVERAASLVGGRLHAAQVIEGAGRRAAAGKARRGDRARV